MSCSQMGARLALIREVVAALVGLGYSQAEALEAVAKSEPPADAPVEDRVRLALGYFARARAGGA